MPRSKQGVGNQAHVWATQALQVASQQGWTGELLCQGSSSEADKAAVASLLAVSPRVLEQHDICIRFF